jgi:hypothetical protein
LPHARSRAHGVRSRGRRRAGAANLFECSENRVLQLATFRTPVANAPKKGNVYMVTHGPKTLAFTGVSPATAEMVIVTAEGGGRGASSRRRARLAVDGRSYQSIRWSNSCSGAG